MSDGKPVSEEDDKGATVRVTMPRTMLDGAAWGHDNRTIEIWGTREALEALRLEIDSAVEMLGGEQWRPK